MTYNETDIVAFRTIKVRTRKYFQNCTIIYVTHITNKVTNFKISNQYRRVVQPQTVVFWQANVPQRVQLHAKIDTHGVFELSTYQNII